MLSVPLNGSMTGMSNVFPNSIQFACDQGFINQGSSLRTCQANGIWSGVEARCKGKYPSLNGKKS